MADVCSQCGNEYQRVATHWNQSSGCVYRNFTKNQREVIVGLLMGDGCVDNSDGKNPRLVANMISSNYLKYVDEKFGIFSNGVSLSKTAAENAKKNRETGFNPKAKEENYSDIYRWYSIRHPELEEFDSWYNSRQKLWPEDIELTPTVLKHWYCGDGHWENSGTSNYINISMSNEVENTEKVDSIFENVGLPSPDNYKIYERCSGRVDCDARFTVDQSHKLWQYMGEPLPDFEYKWPEEYR